MLLTKEERGDMARQRQEMCALLLSKEGHSVHISATDEPCTASQDTRNKITAPVYGGPSSPLRIFKKLILFQKENMTEDFIFGFSFFHAILFDSKNALYSFKLDSYVSNFLLDDYIYSLYTTAR